MATDVEIKLKAKNEASAQIQKVKGDLTGLKGAFAGGLVGGVVGSLGLTAIDSAIGQVSALVSEIGAMAVQAGAVSELTDAFDELTAGMGQSSRAMMQAAQLGTRGLVKEAELVTASNRAMMLEVIDTNREMAAVWALSEKNADALGQSIEETFASIVSGVNTQRERTLAAAGVVVDVKQAMDEYAQSLGITAEHLDNVQRKQAVLNAIIAQAPTPGSGADSAADAAQRQEVAVDRARLAVGRLFAPSVTAGANGLTDTIDLLTGRFDAYAAKLRDVSILAAQFNADSRNDPEQVRNFTLLATAMGEVGTALTEGVPNAQQYADALTEIASQAQLQRNISAQTANTIQLAIDGIRAETEAYNQLQAATSSASPYMYQIYEATDAAARAAALATPEFIEAAAKLDALGQIALGTATDVNTLNAAVGALSARMAGLAPVFGALQTMKTSAIAGLQQQAFAAIEAGGDPEEIRQMYAAAADEIWNLPLAVDASTEAMFDNELQVKNTADALGGDYFQSIVDADRASQQFATQGAKQLSQQFDDLKSKVSGVINESMNLGDIKWPGMQGGSERSGDAVNENARRMAAIANEGLQNQPWLEELKNEAPAAYADLMIRIARGMNPQQAAQSIMAEFQDGLRPELLDQDMIKQRVKAMILGENNTAALANEIAGELAGELGIPMQEALAKTQQAMGIAQTGNTGTDGKGADMTGQGSTAGASFVAGFGTTASGATLVGTIVAGMVLSYGQFDSAGRTAGGRWGAAFYAAAQTGLAPQLLDLLVTLVTPGVAANINATKTQTNPDDVPPGGTP